METRDSNGINAEEKIIESFIHEREKAYLTKEVGQSIARIAARFMKKYYFEKLVDAEYVLTDYSILKCKVIDEKVLDQELDKTLLEMEGYADNEERKKDLKELKHKLQEPISFTFDRTMTYLPRHYFDQKEEVTPFAGYEEYSFIISYKTSIVLCWKAINDDEMYLHNFVDPILNEKEEKLPPQEKAKIIHAAKLKLAKEDKINRIHTFFQDAIRTIYINSECHFGNRKDAFFATIGYQGVKFIQDQRATIRTFLKEYFQTTFWKMYESADKKKMEKLYAALIKWIEHEKAYDLYQLIDNVALNEELNNYYIECGVNPQAICLDYKVRECLNESFEFSVDYTKHPTLFAIAVVLKINEKENQPERNAALRKLKQKVKEKDMVFVLKYSPYLERFCKEQEKWLSYQNNITLYGEKEINALQNAIQKLKNEFDAIAKADIHEYEPSNESLSFISECNNAIDVINKESLADEIKNSFAKWFYAVEKSNKNILRKIYLMLLDPVISKKIILTDEIIAQMAEKNRAVFDFDLYGVNRIFWHAIMVPQHLWSELFKSIFSDVYRRVKDRVQNQEVTAKNALYAPALMSQLEQYWIQLQRAPDLNREVKEEEAQIAIESRSIIFPLDSVKSADEWVQLVDTLGLDFVAEHLSPKIEGVQYVPPKALYINRMLSRYRAIDLAKLFKDYIPELWQPNFLLLFDKEDLCVLLNAINAPSKDFITKITQDPLRSHIINNSFNKILEEIIQRFARTLDRKEAHEFLLLSAEISLFAGYKLPKYLSSVCVVSDNYYYGIENAIPIDYLQAMRWNLKWILSNYIIEGNAKTIDECIGENNFQALLQFYLSRDEVNQAIFQVKLDLLVDHLHKLEDKHHVIYQILFEPTIQAAILFDPNTVAELLAHHSSYNLDQSKANRVFLHAIIESPHQWSGDFYELLQRALDSKKMTFSENLRNQINYLQAQYLAQGQEDKLEEMAKPDCMILLPYQVENLEEWDGIMSALGSKKSWEIINHSEALKVKFFSLIEEDCVKHLDQDNFAERVGKYIHHAEQDDILVMIINKILSEIKLKEDKSEKLFQLLSHLDQDNKTKALSYLAYIAENLFLFDGEEYNDVIDAIFSNLEDATVSPEIVKALNAYLIKHNFSLEKIKLTFSSKAIENIIACLTRFNTISFTFENQTIADIKNRCRISFETVSKLNHFQINRLNLFPLLAFGILTEDEIHQINPFSSQYRIYLEIIALDKLSDPHVVKVKDFLAGGYFQFINNQIINRFNDEMQRIYRDNGHAPHAKVTQLNAALKEFYATMITHILDENTKLENNYSADLNKQLGNKLHEISERPFVDTKRNLIQSFLKGLAGVLLALPLAFIPLLSQQYRLRFFHSTLKCSMTKMEEDINAFDCKKGIDA